MRYTSRGLRRRRNTDKWEVTLTHRDPVTGEQVSTYHTVEAKTEKQAQRKRDELILELERKGGAAGSKATIEEFVAAFLDYKEKAATVELSTIRGYRHESKLICRYIGDMRLGELGIADVNGFMARMTADSYSPKSVAGPFRLLKQALKWAVAQDMLTKNPCDFCKPPKRAKTKINALNREERTRMLGLARQAPGQPLAMAIELALTTGMRRGEICALRWSDLGDDGTNTYADVDPDAKLQAVGKIEDSFDIDMAGICGGSPLSAPAPQPQVPGVTFTVEQLEAMLAQAKRLEETR